MHIERQLENQKINVPADYINVYEKARSKQRLYKVEYLKIISISEILQTLNKLSL